ncbi:ribosomal protein S10 domain-containing protein [Lipomyces japonicus]|uniref:mitochondrial 37S ribosomal protein uS10m n=1 Tax=Lipomyces japonicus TaxID=56871 RepID=UPI0034CD2E59
MQHQASRMSFRICGARPIQLAGQSLHRGIQIRHTSVFSQVSDKVGVHNLTKNSQTGQKVVLSSTADHPALGRPIPLNVELNHYAPLKVSIRHDIRVAELFLHSYIKEDLEFFADFALRAAFYLDIPAKGAIPLKRKVQRWTMPKSPFVHTKVKDTYERITYKRKIVIYDTNLETIELWLSVLRKYEFAGVGLKANLFSNESIDLELD